MRVIILNKNIKIKMNNTTTTMKLTCATRIALFIGAFVVLSSSSSSVQAVPVSLRSLQSSDTTSDLVATEFSYGYKLLYKITEQHPEVGAALTTVQDAVLLSLNQVIERTGADVEIQFLASKETGTSRVFCFCVMLSCCCALFTSRTYISNLGCGLTLFYSLFFHVITYRFLRGSLC
jgi:hypothetical protein